MAGWIELIPTMPLRFDWKQNSGGFLHGGATASLVDLVASAVFRTAGLRTKGEPLEMNISYLDAAFADVSRPLLSPALLNPRISSSATYSYKLVP
jgi:acyl-coenzyme A thioesterase PaaI-like protein